MKRTLFLVPLLAAFLLPAAYAQNLPEDGFPPISIQGRLTTPDGTPVPDRDYTISIRLYDEETGGMPLGNATDLTVSTQGGVFHSSLPDPDSIFNIFDEEPKRLFLELSLAGETLAPRMPISSVPFALQAEQAQQLGSDALQAGANVTLERQDDGALMISAAGGGTGGLASVASDATLEGNGTGSSPLGLADGAVTGAKLADGAIRGSGDITVTRVESEDPAESFFNVYVEVDLPSTADPVTGDGTPENPLTLADGAVTGAKLADGALAAGANVTIARQQDGSLEIAATGGGTGGGLASVASDATLEGDGTAGDPLAVSAPLVLTGVANGIVQGTHTDGNAGILGSIAVGVLGLNTNGNSGQLGTIGSGVFGMHADGHSGHLGGSDYGAFGQHNNGHFGRLGDSERGAYGEHSLGHFGYLGGSLHGVFGEHISGNYGILGGSLSGVFGFNANFNIGYLASSDYGAFGQHNNGHFGSLGNGSSGVRGEHTNGNVGTLGGQVSGARGGHSNGNFGRLGHENYGAYGEHDNGHFGSLGNGSSGVRGDHTNGTHGWLGSGAYGVYGEHGISGNVGYFSDLFYGAYGSNSNGNWGALGTSNRGVYAENSNGQRGLLAGNSYGAYGEYDNGTYGYLGGSGAGAYGESDNGTYGWLGSPSTGAYGEHNNGNVGRLGHGNYGVYGEHNNGNFGYLGGSDYGAYGEHNNGHWARLGTEFVGIRAHGIPDAAAFVGDVHISGMLSKTGGSFKIDHPLDPAGKYLVHSFVESPDMMNVYNGNVTTDARGRAVVELPPYFEALNRDFRYQLTVIGTFAQVIIAEEIEDNRFVIRTDQPGVKVSWQVTGIRQDPWANAHRIVVEEDKPAIERGFYLHPKLYGQPEERSIEWARDPDGMRAMQERPTQIEAERERIKAEPEPRPSRRPSEGR